MEQDPIVSGLQLGFIEPIGDSREWLEPRFFPSKIGGKPVWINPQYLPSEEVMACKNCGDPMFFLLQFYAPLNANSECYHRTLYIFCCSRGRCLREHPEKSYLVLRGQIPRENPYYIDNGEYDESTYYPEDLSNPKVQFRLVHTSNCCTVCGQRANKKCSRCSIAYYCSIKHQRLHFKLGGHKDVCGTVDDHNLLLKWSDNICILPEYEIITETEEDVKEQRLKIDESKHQILIDKYNSEVAEDKMNGIPEVEIDESDLPRTNVDPLFVKFQTVISEEPEQILRYVADKSAQPLWMYSEGIKKSEDVPKCFCGKKRAFEFQVLPQLIFHLNVEKYEGTGNYSEEIDWGTLVIYTCEDSCSIPIDQDGYGKYAVEYIYQQAGLEMTEKCKN